MQYRRRDSIARLYEVSPRTVDNMVKEMEEAGIYPDDFYLKDIGYVLIEEDAFRHFLQYRRSLKGAGAKLVPAYVRKEKAEAIYVIGGQNETDSLCSNIKRRAGCQ